MLSANSVHYNTILRRVNEFVERGDLAHDDGQHALLLLGRLCHLITTKVKVYAERRVVRGNYDKTCGTYSTQEAGNVLLLVWAGLGMMGYVDKDPTIGTPPAPRYVLECAGHRAVFSSIDEYVAAVERAWAQRTHDPDGPWCSRKDFQ